jgi:hypothetical protein
MKSHKCLDCGHLLCSRLCDQPSASDLRWVRNFKANHRGLDPRNLRVKYPTDNRCQRCGGRPSRFGYRLIADFDRWLERHGFSASESFRGWVCNQCRSDLSMYDYGDDDGSEYMFVRVRRRLNIPDLHS